LLTESEAIRKKVKDSPVSFRDLNVEINIFETKLKKDSRTKLTG
jgi:hypothetical protein